MKKKIVVAIGGNAILENDPTAEGQQKIINDTVKELLPLVKSGNQLIIIHGNGPQVGNILLQQKGSDSIQNPAMQLDTCVSMTQGSIGYWLQNSIKNYLLNEEIDKDVVTIITQVEVDGNDHAFSNPTKPIGPFFAEEEAKIEAQKDGSVYIEDSGRGWRKVVASPSPINVVESRVIKSLVESDVIVVSSGGGGIPVIKVGNEYRGVDAVVDKDLTAERVAELIEADYLILLTAVDNVFINYGKANQEKLKLVSLNELKGYIEENQFPKGSMLPKIEAAMSFVKKSAHGRAIITSLKNVKSILDETVGTVITKQGAFNLVIKS